MSSISEGDIILDECIRRRISGNKKGYLYFYNIRENITVSEMVDVINDCRIDQYDDEEIIKKKINRYNNLKELL